MSYSLVLERTSGNLLVYGLAAIRFANHLHVLCSMPLLRAEYTRKITFFDRDLHHPRLMSRWCLSQKGMVFSAPAVILAKNLQIVETKLRPAGRAGSETPQIYCVLAWQGAA